MKTFCVTKSAYEKYRESVCSIVLKFESIKTSQTVFIDTATAKREERGVNDFESYTISIRDLIDTTLSEAGVIDVASMTDKLACSSPYNFVFIDASNVAWHSVESFFSWMTKMIFETGHTSNTYILICADTMKVAAVNLLASSFYLRPDILTKSEVLSKCRKIYFRAKVLRFFGSKSNLFSKFVFFLADGLDNRFRKLRNFR